jgi:hypothetical protein
LLVDVLVIITRQVTLIHSLDYELASVTHLDATTSLLVDVQDIATQQETTTTSLVAMQVQTTQPAH